MDSQSQCMKDFESIEMKVQRSKRRHVTRTTKEGAHVSSFIKSALAEPDTSCVRPGTSGAFPPSEGRQGKRKMKLTRKGNPHVKKKLKLGGDDWNSMLSKVKWPGLDEQPDNRPDISGSESSGIQSYSEEESNVGSDLNHSLDDISSEDEDEDNSRLVGRKNTDEVDTRVKQSLKSSKCSFSRKRWRKTMDLLHTSTPVQNKAVESEMQLETISDFGLSDTESTPPHHTTDLLPTMTHKTKLPSKKNTFQFQFHSNLQSTPDNASISTPPSLPDYKQVYLETEDNLSRTKTSEWIKQVSLDSETTRVGETSMSDTTFVMKTPHDSAKKSSSRRGGRRLVVGGMAEQLQKVIQRENVEVTFWEHKVKQLEEGSVDVSTCLKVHVTTLTSCYSLFLANCRLLQGQPSSETTHPISRPGVTVCGNELTVLFSSHCARGLNLRVGSVVRIHPPWQCLTLTSLAQDILLCALFCQSIGYTHISSSDTPTSPIPCKQRGVVGMLNVHSPMKSPLPTNTSLVRSPTKIHGLPSRRLFEGEQIKLEKATHQTDKNYKTTLNPIISDLTSIASDGGGLPDHPDTFLDAIEHAQYGVVAGLTGRVVRVYRRKGPRQLRILGTTDIETTVEKKYSHLCQSLLHNRETCDESAKVIWCLLLCDATGMFVEVQVTDTTGKEWSELVKCGEGVAIHLTRLRLIRRTNNNRNPELASLVSSLTLDLPKTLSTPTHSPIQDGTSSIIPSPVFHHTPPTFCYILQTQSDSQAHFLNDQEHIENRLPTVANGGVGELVVECGEQRAEQKECSRLSLLGRVAYFCKEYSTSDDSSALQTLQASNCSAYLHVLTFKLHAPSTTLTNDPSTTLTNDPSTTLTNHPSTTLTTDPFTTLTTDPSTTLTNDPSTTLTNDPSTALTNDPSTTLTTDTSTTVTNDSRLLMIYLKPSFPTRCLEDTLSRSGAEILLRDVYCNRNDTTGKEYVMDACSMIIPLCTNVDEVYPVSSLSKNITSKLRSLVLPKLPVVDVNNARVGSLVTVTGTVVNVDEDNAYSWPVCDVCGSEQLDDASSKLCCNNCKRIVVSSDIHMQLAVYLKCPGLQNTTILAKLRQSTISELLPVSTYGDDSGFDVHCVLKKVVYLNSCIVEDIITHNDDGTVLIKLNQIDINFMH